MSCAIHLPAVSRNRTLEAAVKERDAQLAEMAKEHAARIEKLRGDLDQRLADVSSA